MTRKKITILGSTGSIGTQTLDIIGRHHDLFEVVGLVAGRNLDVLTSQIVTFRPACVSVADEKDLRLLRERFSETTFVCGEKGACEVAALPDADLVVSAIVGAAGLRPTMAALEAEKPVALANKESLVVAGKLMTEKAREKGVSLLPVDSEHSAIFQALQGNTHTAVRKLILTASGGPFFRREKSTFPQIRLEDALQHPNWDMGAKITIDSATMMNKGLEVIEASWLFEMPVDSIDMVVHPKSIVHSLVEYCDSSVMAQMGVPDMRCAISYALAYPERIVSGVDSLNLVTCGPLEFFAPDLDKFPCIRLAMEAAREGGTFPAVLNAANETAVAAFLAGHISFIDISHVIEACMEKHQKQDPTTLDHLHAVDVWARKTTGELIQKI